MRRTAAAILAMLVSLMCLAGVDKVSMLTVWPGSDIYTLEGHTALRLQGRDALNREFDVALNWGAFDFNTPGFVYRFVKGETDYFLSSEPTGYFKENYRREGRMVMEQELELDSVQREALLEAILENMKPENVQYRYNYVYDNCATRPLQIVENAVPGLRLGTPSNGDEHTFRQVMRRYHQNYPWYQFGIDLALGAGIDKRISEREKTFAPIEMMETLDGATLADGRKLVKRKEVLVQCADSAVLPPTPWYATPMAVAWVILLLAVAGMRWLRFGRVFDTVMFALWGVMGLLLTFLIFVSSHEATSPNWLYLWLNPLDLFVAVALWVKGWHRALRWSIGTVGVGVIAVGIIGLCGVQSLNPAFWPLLGATLLRCADNLFRKL